MPGLLGTGRAEVRLSVSQKQRGEAGGRGLTLTMVLRMINKPQDAPGDLWSLGLASKHPGAGGPGAGGTPGPVGADRVVEAGDGPSSS